MLVKPMSAGTLPHNSGTAVDKLSSQCGGWLFIKPALVKRRALPLMQWRYTKEANAWKAIPVYTFAAVMRKTAIIPHDTAV